MAVEVLELVELLALSVDDVEGSAALVFEVVIDEVDVELVESTVVDVAFKEVEVVEESGLSGRFNELDIESTNELADEVAAVPNVEPATSVVEGPLTATVEEGKKLKEGMVLLSIKVNDREIEVEDVDSGVAVVSLVVEVTAVDGVERNSDVENVDSDGSPSADEDEASIADDVDDDVTAMLEVFANLYTLDAAPASRHRNLSPRLNGPAAEASENRRRCEKRTKMNIGNVF